MSFWVRFRTPVIISRVFSQTVIKRTTHTAVNKHINITSHSINLHPQKTFYDLKRYKSKKNKYDSDDEDTIIDDDTSLSKDSKVVKFNTTSMRADIILKSALGVARNKIEQAFYESKIRVNGKKIMKKSVSIKLGDEIDVIKMVSPKNPEHIYVSRVEIVNIAPTEENISVTARRFKNLLIENYEQDSYKGSSNDS